MTSGGGGGPPPPNSGGEFLLQLLQKPQQRSQHTPPPHHQYLDPAVGPTIHHHRHHPSQPQWLNRPTPNNTTPWGLAGLPPPPNLSREFQQLGVNGRPTLQLQQMEEKNTMMFGSIPQTQTQFRGASPSSHSHTKTPPPGFTHTPNKNAAHLEHPSGSKLRSVPAPALDIEQDHARYNHHHHHHRRRDEASGQMDARRWKEEQDRRRNDINAPITQISGNGRRRKDDLSNQLMNSVRLSIGLENNADSQHKNFKLDISSELQPPGYRMRNHKRVVDCRSDIDKMNAPFLAIFESLVPAEEEKAKQKQLLSSLEKLVNKEWPKSQLYLYGSCANSFGVSNSDIDVCLAIEGDEINKSELLLRLADILKEDNLENVQALTHARVPIVKLMDPVTGISCDICVNNVLAVVNTKLLRDYAEIDCRLRQLAFIVKHWAKSRGVNVTYKGTLSSYAYVLMCIHFLQQRRPAILPCLQGMEATYVVTVEDIECSYFDKVENLRDFGSQNKESIAQLVWAFFDYWAYRHDYSNAVISVRTGGIISKRAKDWTRRIGNDRHLVCIEDPFETSHDLGRVVDKYSIKILRDEFQRAANIMQLDPDPCVALFEPFVPES